MEALQYLEALCKDLGRPHEEYSAKLEKLRRSQPMMTNAQQTQANTSTRQSSNNESNTNNMSSSNAPAASSQAPARSERPGRPEKTSQGSIDETPAPMAR